mgnify:CR=1 FL=1
MNTKIFYYARVSSREQNLDRQIEAFKTLGADEREIICDKESGKNLERVGYQALKNTMLRSGDTLIIKSLDRLSRNKTDIKNELFTKGVKSPFFILFSSSHLSKFWLCQKPSAFLT